MICDSQLPKRGKLNIGLVQSLRPQAPQVRREAAATKHHALGSIGTWFYQAR